MKPLLPILFFIINGCFSSEWFFISYLLHYVLTHPQIQGAYINYLGVSLGCLFVALIGLGRYSITVTLLSVSLLLAYCTEKQWNLFGLFCRKNLSWYAQCGWCSCWPSYWTRDPSILAHSWWIHRQFCDFRTKWYSYFNWINSAQHSFILYNSPNAGNWLSDCAHWITFLTIFSRFLGLLSYFLNIFYM